MAREVVEGLLEAAVTAPSPHNRQPWRFAVLVDPGARAELARAMGDRLRADRLADGDPLGAVEADVARSRARIEGAPVAILAALSMEGMDAYPDPRRAAAERLMAVQAVAAALQNLWLAAEAQGLGCSWMCAPLFCPEVARGALDLPQDWEPQALLLLGWPAAPGRPRPRRPLAELVVWRDGRTLSG